MDACEQGAVGSAGEVLLQLGEADKDEGEQGSRIPLVIQEAARPSKQFQAQYDASPELTDGFCQPTRNCAKLDGGCIA